MRSLQAQLRKQSGEQRAGFDRHGISTGSLSFTYEIYSINDALENEAAGGPLREGRKVIIWHNDGKILRIDDAGTASSTTKPHSFAGFP